jgi:hypothetical protein
LQLGLQTLPMLLSSELFPSEVRAFCKGVTRSFACIMLVLSLKFFPLIEETLTLYGTFFLFAGILVASLPVVYWCRFYKSHLQFYICNLHNFISCENF